MTTTSLSLSLSSSLPHVSISIPQFHKSLNTHNPASLYRSSLSLSPKKPTQFQRFPFPQKKTLIWRIYATPEEIPPLESTSTAEQIVSATGGGGDGVSNIISILLFIAFVGLSVLTIGIVYIAVTDFLQKRETDKFAKEEEAKKKKGGKRKRVKARTGPRGFGQKIDDFEEFDD